MIALWEVRPPVSVAKPSTKRLSSCAVLEGSRSWLMTMQDSFSCLSCMGSTLPWRL